MILNTETLVQGNLRSGVPVVQIIDARTPFTPFFLGAGDNFDGRVYTFSGGDFYAQNQYTTDDNTRTPICGYAAYRTKTIAQDYVAGETYEAHRDSSSYDWVGVLNYVFDTVANTVALEEDVTTSGTLYDAILEPPVYTVNTCTCTGSFFHDEGTGYNPPRVDHYDTNDYILTLSSQLTTSWLEGKLTEWMAEGPEFREATGSFGVSSTQTETVDGVNCAISGGFVRAIGHWFSGTPVGATGDEGDLWNGNYQAYLIRRRRKNAAVLHAGAGVAADGSLVSASTVAGESIYGNGTEEMELEDEVTGFLVDKYGTYEWTMGAWDSGLADVALGVINPIPHAGIRGGVSLLAKGGVGPWFPNEVMFVSRTGKEFRITIELGAMDMYGEWVQEALRSCTTDAATLRATLKPEAADGLGWEGRFVSIETRVSSEAGWVMIANADNEAYPDLPLPETLIGDDVGDRTPIFGAYRARGGGLLGFRALDFSTRYFRKQTFRQHRTTYDVGTVPDSGCGSVFPVGTLDLEWEQEYINGLLQEKVLIEYSRIVDGVDWSRETPFIGQNGGSVSGDVVVSDTATLKRMETTGQALDGFYSLAFDQPDVEGKIISSTESLVSMDVVGEEILSGEQEMLPPAAGSTLYLTEIWLKP